MDGIEHSWTNHGEQGIGENKSSCLLTIFDAASVVREYPRGVALSIARSLWNYCYKFPG